MSKVIKAAAWRERPKIIEAPRRQTRAAEEADAPGAFDADAQQRMLAEIAAKEQHADELLRNAQTESQVLRQEAQNECDRLREETEQECEELKEEARKQGHQEGFAAGEAEGREKAQKDMEAQIQAANQKAEKTLRDAKAATVDYLAQAEDDVTRIALAVVEKILPQHFIDVPQVILPLVQKALQKVKDQKEIAIHVAPAVYDLVLMARDELRSQLVGAGADLSIVSDESLVPGDCVIETPNGSVDARLQTQIELIRQAIQEVKA